jgi:hypothetical protein
MPLRQPRPPAAAAAHGNRSPRPGGTIIHSDPGFPLRKCSHFLPRAGARGSAAIDAIFA